MPYVTVSGKKIYFEEYGEKEQPTIVYLHGGPGESCLTYAYQARKLGERHHVISLDQYGVFRSDSIPDGQRAGVKFHVELIEQMRRALEIKRWIPLGHSFGGMLALLYAATYPDSIDAVIYDCPMWSALHTARAIAKTVLPFAERSGDPAQSALCKEILDPRISAREAFDKAMRIDLNEDVQRDCHVIEKSRYDRYINDHIPEPDVTEDCWGKYVSFTQKLRDEEDFYTNYLPCLEQIRQPQLLMVGEYDMTCGKYEQAFFRQHAPNGSMVTLENSAHLSWFEQPKKYTELMTAFVEGLQTP